MPNQSPWAEQASIRLGLISIIVTLLLPGYPAQTAFPTLTAVRTLAKLDRSYHRCYHRPAQQRVVVLTSLLMEEMGR